jgi:hypothetical protein
MSDLKMFVYISHAKVDMLYQQLPRKDATGAEYGIDVKFLKWVGKREPAKEAGPIDKLFAVVEHLKRSGKVGTYPNPLQYIEGTADMTWGTVVPPVNLPIPTHPLEVLPPDPTHEEIIQMTRHVQFSLFAAKSKRTVMALVGSVNHLIGSGSGPYVNVAPCSNFDAAEQALSFLIQSGRGETALTSALACPSDLTPADLEVAIRYLKGTEQRLEFFARIYDIGEAGGVSVLIGSPLYVALAD